MFYFFFYLYMKKDKIDVIRKVIDINLIIYFECYFGNCDGNIKLFFLIIGINIKIFNCYD